MKLFKSALLIAGLTTSIFFAGVSTSIAREGFSFMKTLPVSDVFISDVNGTQYSAINQYSDLSAKFDFSFDVKGPEGLPASSFMFLNVTAMNILNEPEYNLAKCEALVVLSDGVYYTMKSNGHVFYSGDYSDRPAILIELLNKMENTKIVNISGCPKNFK